MSNQGFDRYKSSYSVPESYAVVLPKPKTVLTLGKSLAPCFGGSEPEDLYNDLLASVEKIIPPGASTEYVEKALRSLVLEIREARRVAPPTVLTSDYLRCLFGLIEQKDLIVSHVVGPSQIIHQMLALEAVRREFEPCTLVSDLKQGYLGYLWGAHVVCDNTAPSLRFYAEAGVDGLLGPYTVDLT